MNMLKKFIIILCVFFSVFSSVYAQDVVDPRMERAYNKFIIKVDAQLTDSKKLILLEKLWNKIDIFFDTKKLSSANQSILSDLNKLNNEEIFSMYIENEKKKTQSKILSYSSTDRFLRISENKENLFLEDGVWYFYDFKTTHFFEKDNVDVNTLSYNNINPQTDLVILRDTSWPWFVTDFDRIKLISDHIIYGIPDKYEFLKEIRNDQRHLKTTNTDTVFLNMKKEVESIILSQKKEDKIATIYDWMLSNLEYTQNFDLDDKRIFSWSETYSNRDWVCEWYTKVMMYMLNFAGVRNSIVMRGDVIDAVDFPQIGHAWVRVWQDFYDPTFDDPIGAVDTRSPDKYRYYKLPKDIMYTNRFDLEKTPKALESTNIEFRQQLVWQKLFALTNKYSSKDYLLLWPSEFRKSIGLTFDDTVSFNDLKKKVVFLEVQSDFSTSLNGKKRYLQWFQYFPMANDGSNIDSLLNQLNYDLNGYYLMKFDTDASGNNFEYRLAYNVNFR